MIVIAEDSVRFAHSGPSHNLLRPTIYFVPLSRNSYLAGPSPCPCPGVDTPPQSLPSSLLKTQHKNMKPTKNHFLVGFVLI